MEKAPLSAGSTMNLGPEAPVDAGTQPTWLPPQPPSLAHAPTASGEGPDLGPGPSAPSSHPGCFDLPAVDVDRYDIESEHARGGLGRILGAWDRRLDRFLALKELLVSEPQAEARFIREALITARLQHPSIVPVYDAGRRPDGRVFYTMKMISGHSLKEAIAKTRNLDERLALVPNLLAVADAVAYAHGMGILHRDLKPANILIGPFGETVVIDWGLAKDLRHAEEALVNEVGLYDLAVQDLTVVGTVFGTPQYMPPEQARGEQVDERADVYALGAVLYHLLAGIPSYQGTHPSELLSQVLAAPPLSLEARQPGVPSDLATIVRKAMARDPRERYPTARELAEDLRRFQTGQLISARHYSTGTLLVRWFMRHRLAAVLVASVLMVLGFLLRDAQRRVRERSLSDAMTLVRARGALERDPTESVAWIKTYPPDGAGWDPARDIVLEAHRRGVARHILHRGDSSVCFGDFSPDSRYYAGTGPNDTLRLWDTRTGETWKRLEHVGRLFVAQFLPDGKRIAFADGRNNVLRLWDLEHDTVQELPDQDGPVVDVIFSPDGRLVVPIALGRTLQLWSPAGKLHTIEGHEPTSESVFFSPDGQLLIFAGEERTVRLYELATGRQRILQGHEDEIRLLTISSDSKRLVSTARDGSLRLWDVASGRLLRTFHSHQGGINGLVLASDGRHAATAGNDRTVRLWDLTAGESQILQGPLELMNFLEFSPDGHLLAGAGQFGTVRLWNIETGDSWVLPGHRTDVYQVAFSPDGKFLASSAGDRTTRLWELSPRRVRILSGHEDNVAALAFSSDGRLLASASRDTTLRLWDLVQGGSRRLVGHEQPVWYVAFSPDQTHLASAGWDATVRLWDVASGQGRIVCEPKAVSKGVAFSADGQLLACATGDSIQLVRVQDGTSRVLRGPPDRIRVLSFAGQGHLLATGNVKGQIRLWDVDKGDSVALGAHEGAVERVAFSHDGRWLASTGADDTVRLWEVQGRQGRPIDRHAGHILTMGFSADDRFLGSAGEDQFIHLYDLTSGTVRKLPGHDSAVQSLAFSPRGRLLASVGWDGMIRVWDAATGLPERFYQHGSLAPYLAFSPDGQLIATAGADRLIRLWPVATDVTPPKLPSDVHTWMERLTSVALQDTGSPRTP
jgi:WD40 repeat protein